MPDVPAARSALRLITELAGHADPVPASTLARTLDLPRSSVYQLLRVLQDEGYVVHYPELRAYGLGALVSEIGGAVSRTTRLARLGSPLLEALVREARVPVVAHLAVLAGSDVSYLAQASAPRAPTTVIRVGVRLPAHLTATGRAMLAALPAAQVTALFPHNDDLVTRSGIGPRTRAELDAILRIARAHDLASESGEITDDYASVASAVRDRSGYPAAGIGVTYRADTVDAAARDALATAVRRASDALTSRLTGRTGPPAAPTSP